MTFNKEWSEKEIIENIELNPLFMKQALLELYKNIPHNFNIKRYAEFILQNGLIPRSYFEIIRDCLLKFTSLLVKIFNAKHSNFTS